MLRVGQGTWGGELASNNSGTNSIAKILAQTGYVPQLPRVDLQQPVPRTPEENTVFPTAPAGLPPEWDYRKSQSGPDGQPLPRGAIGWTPHGEPFYGGNSATGNWLKGFVSRFTAPSNKDETSGQDLAARSVQAILGEGDYKGQPVIGRLGAALSNGFGAFGQAFKDFGVDEEGTPTPLTYVTRFINEGAGLVLALGQEAAEEVEQIRGGLIGAAGGELNPLDQWLQNTTKQYEGNWANFFRSMIFSVNVPGMLWDTARAITSPVADKGEAFGEGYEAGRILYTQFIDPAVREEYIRRFRAGENPYLLAEELQNPAAEIGGELIADPLNFVGFFFKAGRKAGWADDAARRFTTLDPRIDAVRTIGKVANETDAAAGIGRVVDGTMAWAKDLRTGLSKVDEGLMALNVNSKRAKLAGEVGTMAWGIAASQANKANKIDDTIDIFRALINLHSDDARRIQESLSVLRQSGLPIEMVMSDVAGELGYVLKVIVGDSPKSFIDDLGKSSGAEDLFAKFGKRLDGAVDEIIPTLEKRVRPVKDGGLGQTLSAKGRAIMAAEGVLKSDPYRFSKKFFGSLYMGYSPGYATRNIVQNYMHLFIDEGLGTVVQEGRLFTPTRAKDFIQRAIGRVPESATQGLGAAEGIASGPMSKLSSAAESGAATQIYAKSLKDTLHKSYDAIFSDLGQDMLKSGWSQGDVALMRGILGDTHDMSQVQARISEMYRKGYVDVFSEFEWIDPKLSRHLDDFGGLDAYKDALRTATSADEAVQASADFFKRHFEDYAKTAGEIPTGIPAEMLDEAAALMGEANQQGYMSDSVKELAFSQRMANQAAEDAWVKVIDDMNAVAKRIGVDLSPVYARIPGAEFVDNKKMIVEARRQFDSWANGTRARFEDLMKSGESLQEVAKKIGFADELPPGANEYLVRNYFWEHYFYPKQRAYFDAYRDSFVGLSNAILDEAGKLDPRLVNGQLKETALRALGESRLWQSASVSGRGLGVAGAGREVDAIRKLAMFNGIATQSRRGASLDNVLLRTINKYSDIKFDDLSQVPFDQAQKAIEARQIANGAEFVPVADASFAERVRRAPELVAPMLGDAMPSPARMVYEQLDGLRDMQKNFEGAIRNSYGTQRAVFADAAKQSAFENLVREGSQRVASAKIIGQQVAKATRDFALLDYGARKNFDAFLGLIYPYHYWHSRTYVNWLKRVASDPGIVAAYSKYRDTLAEVHAGAPDWWKYNVNSAELFGLFKENPLFFNLEATLNPLNGLTGVDFEDPYKRVNMWTALLDDLGKLGPSPWTMFSLAAAVALQMSGEEDAAARWGGRLIPQTQTIQALQSIGEGGLDLGALYEGGPDVTIKGLGENSLSFLDPFTKDPAVSVFAGGVDPYTRNRVGRSLAQMVLDGEISEEQAIDASYVQSGELWDRALERAINERAPGQIASFLLGVGFRARSAGDLQSDQFYQDYFRLINLRDTVSTEQYQTEMGSLRERYPFMDSLLLSKKGGEERDSGLAFSVLSRIPPGGSSVSEAVGLDPRLLGKFYDTKGDFSSWNGSDKQRFMASVVDLMGLLATPDNATRNEWSQVGNAYGQMEDALEDYYGSDILDRIDEFYRQLGISSDAGNAFIAANPDVDEALTRRSGIIAQTPLLATYYGGYSAIEKYYKNLMYDDIEAQMGDIWSKFNANTATRSEQNRYAKIRDSWLKRIDEAVFRIGNALPEKKGVAIRSDLPEPLSTGQQDFLQSIQAQTVSEADVISGIGITAYDIVIDSLSGGRSMPSSVRTRLESYAESIGISFYELMRQIGNMGR